MSHRQAQPAAHSDRMASGPTAHATLAFRVDGVGYRWADVFAHARRRGDWRSFEIEVRQALACLRRAAEQGPPPDHETQRSTATEFRRARRLLAAEDLESWLTERGLTVAQWRRYIRGETLRKRHAAELDTLVDRYPPDDAVADTALPIWGTCSGAFSDWAEALANRAAAAHAVCEDTGRPPPEPDDLDTHETLFDRFAAHAATAERLEALIASRYLDWLHVDCDIAVFTDPDTAAEARLCVHDDGWSLAEAARAGGAALRATHLLVEDVAAGARADFVRARDGDLLGPLELGSGPALVRVRRKSPPSLDDVELRTRATRELVATAVAREVDDRVERLYPS